MRDATNIAAIAAVVLALIALIGLAAPVYSRLGQLEAEIKHTRDLNRVEHEATRAEIRRLTEGLSSHYHDSEGRVIYVLSSPSDQPQTE